MAEEAKWYVVHTYSGYENAVAAAIVKAAENRRMQDLIQEVNIPLETVTEVTDNGPTVFERGGCRGVGKYSPVTSWSR